MQELLPTTRLKFVAITNDIRHHLGDLEAFSKTYGLAVPKDWPLMSDTFEMGEGVGKPKQNDLPWCSYLFLNFKGTQIIGHGSYLNAPDKDGAVEITFEIAKEHQDKGYAQEAAGEMLSFALVSGAKNVKARTIAGESKAASILKNIGLKHTSDIEIEGVGKVWLWGLK